MRPRTVAAIASLAAASTIGCSPVRVLDAHAPSAARIGTLWWVLFYGTIVPTLVVFVIVAVAYARGRRAARRTDQPESVTGHRAVVVGTVLVGVVVVGLLLSSLSIGRAFHSGGAPPELTIEVVGHQYWWEVRYVDQGVTTANEVHLPVGKRVAFRLRSDDVIHSFWVPELHGKMDLVPGRTHTISVAPDREGSFLGLCAEFCGTSHALMAFVAVVEPQSRFDRWIEGQRAPAAPPLAEGARVFATAGCPTCHVVRGAFTTADPSLAPDLTHFGSRGTIAAATLPNEPDALRRFLTAPNAVKPEIRMPGIRADEPELAALVAWLGGLR